MSNNVPLTDGEIVAEIRAVLAEPYNDAYAVVRIRELLDVTPDLEGAPAPLTFIVEAIHDLGQYLQDWAGRRPLPEPSTAARAAADEAVGRIDSALQRLVELRSELVAEIRQADAAFLALDDDNEPES